MKGKAKIRSWDIFLVYFIPLLCQTFQKYVEHSENMLFSFHFYEMAEMLKMQQQREENSKSYIRYISLYITPHVCVNIIYIVPGYKFPREIYLPEKS